MHHRTLLASLLLATACAGGSVRGPPALTGEPVTGFSEVTLGRPGHELYLRNNTSSPIRINSFTIFECENIQVRCRTRDVAWLLGPGEVRTALVVEPEDSDGGWRYRWRWTHSGGIVATPRPATGRAAVEPIVLEESDEARVLLDPRGRFVNVVLPPPVAEQFWTGRWEQEKGIGISRILYRSLQDVFDFVFMSFPADEPVDTKPATALAARTRLHTTGLGLRDRDRTRSFGSDGRLMGLIVMSSHEYIDSSIPLHEITHLWGQRLVTTSSNPRVPGHMGFMEGGGYLGGWYPGTLEEAGGGLWLARDPYGGRAFRLAGSGSANYPYAPLELYMMGLLPPDSVPPFQVAEDAQWVSESAGLFRASRIRTITIDDLIATHGPRIPGFPQAPREFRGVYVVVSSTPLDAATRNVIDGDLADLSRPGPREVRRFPNFWEATEGRGRLILDGLVDALRDPSVISAVQKGSPPR